MITFRSCRRSLCLPMAIHAMLTVSVLAGPGRPASRRPLPFSELRLSTRVGQAAYALGEPIALYAELDNPHEAPVRSHDYFGWLDNAGTRRSVGEQDLDLCVSRDGKTFQKYGPGIMPLVLREREAVLMQPGAKRRAKQFVVLARWKLTALQSPGELYLRTKFYGLGRDPSIESTTSVQLRAPTGRDAEALQWLRERQMLRYLGYLYPLVGSFDERHLQAFTEFLQQYPQTVYSPYARFALGQMHFYQKQYIEAIAVLEGLMGQHPKTPVAEDALYLLGECHVLLGKVVEADRWYREVLKNYPDAPAAADAEQMVARLAKHPAMLFRDDRRLDAEIAVHFPEPVPVEEVFRRISQQSGVALYLAPGLRIGPMTSTKVSGSLRRFMSALDDHALTWVRDGKGYRLVPVADPKQE